MRTWLLGLVAATAVLAAGCGSTHTAGMCADDAIPPAKEGDLDAAEKAADAAWAGRADVAKLREAIAHWRESVAIAPTKSVNYVHLARALYFLGDGYLRLEKDEAAESDDDLADAKEKEMVATLEESYLTAEKALRLQNDDYRASACAQEPLEDTVGKIKKADAEAVYWYASALGKYGLATSIVTVLNNKEKIFLIMKRLEKVAPDFFHGGPYRYLGGYYTKVPFPSGDEKLSRQNFEKSIQLAPNYFATRVLFAEMLATKMKNKADGKRIFDEQLKYVLETPASALPEIEPENLLEKRKAQAVKAKYDETFWED